jgi:hypothetical protein
MVPSQRVASAARRSVRFAVAALAFEMFLLGIPASVAPRWFFDEFPVGRGWVAGHGPFNEHAIADFGYAYLGLGVVLVWAAVQPSRLLCRVAAAGATVVNLPHLLFHVTHSGDLSFGDNVTQAALLVVAVLVGVAAVLLSYLPWPAGEESDRESRSRSV